MATEFSHVGPGQPVVHRAHHDLESFFYVLLGICLLYDEPGKIKSQKVLEESFDPFFSAAQPNTIKVTTIQSSFGWSGLMLPHISPYFQPVIPLLEAIRKKLILPIRVRGDKVKGNRKFTHDDFIDEIVVVLAKLPNQYWVAKESRHSKRTRIATSSASMSSTPVTSSTILPNGPLHRPPSIRMSSTSSAGPPKRRRECEDETNSRVVKRRAIVDEAADSGNHSSVETSDDGPSDTSWVETSSLSDSDPVSSV